MFVCATDLPGSAWNNVASSLTNGELEAYSVDADSAAAVVSADDWYDPVNYQLGAGAVAFNHGLQTAASGFHCSACDTFANANGRSDPAKIWPATCNHYGYFRQSAVCEEGDECPLNCIGEWSAWSGCDASCGDATATRQFVVSQQAANAGLTCTDKYGVEEDATETQDCGLDECPVDCVGAWGAWGSCGVTCGEATQSREFEVTQEDAHGGATCPQADGDVDTQDCGLDECPVDCVGAWGAWGSCGVTCGEATQSREFEVTQEDAHGGATCPQADGDVDTQDCGLDECPVDCVGAWGAWGSCGVTCGEATQSREFEVTQEDAHGGATCPQADGDVDTQDCGLDECPVDCVGAWGAWGSCGVTCGEATQSREFEVTQEDAHGGATCPQADGDVDTQDCGLDECPVDCVGAWAEWCSCSSSCGSNGIQGRIFVLASAAQFGGADCVGSDNEVSERSCNTDVPCPVNCFGAWSEWSSCTATCGVGTLSRTFSQSRAAQDGGESCSALFGGEDTSTETKACARPECNDDDDDDDDDRDDDDDNDHGHGFYPIAPYVETQVENGVFSVFGHYSNVRFAAAVLRWLPILFVKYTRFFQAVMIWVTI